MLSVEVISFSLSSLSPSEQIVTEVDLAREDLSDFRDDFVDFLDIDFVDDIDFADDLVRISDSA